MEAPVDMPPSDLVGRAVRAEEVDQLVAMTARAFKIGGPMRGFRQFVETKVPDLQDYRVLAREHRLVAGCGIFRFQANYAPGVMLDAGGLGWVAVDPVEQKRGLGLRLLDEVIGYLERVGCDVCFLKTAQAGFYAHRGWAWGFSTFNHVVPVARLLEIFSENFPGADPARSGPVHWRVGRFQPGELAEIAQLHGEFNRGRPFVARRPLSYWEKLTSGGPIDPARVLRVVDPRGALETYVVFQVVTRNGEDHFVVKEYASRAPPPEIPRLLAILVHVAAVRNCQTLAVELPPTMPLVAYLRDHGARDATGWLSSLMVRVVDLDAFLEKWLARFQTVVRPALAVEALRASPDGHFVLRVDGRRLEIQKEGTNLDARVRVLDEALPLPTIAISREHFGVLTLGNVPVEDLAEAAHLEVTPAQLAILQHAFPDPRGIVYPADGF